MDSHSHTNDQVPPLELAKCWASLPDDFGPDHISMRGLKILANEVIRLSAVSDRGEPEGYPGIAHDLELMRSALDYLLEASDGAGSGYVEGSESDDKWCRRLEDAREEAKVALKKAAPQVPSTATRGVGDAEVGSRDDDTLEPATSVQAPIASPVGAAPCDRNATQHNSELVGLLDAAEICDKMAADEFKTQQYDRTDKAMYACHKRIMERFSALKKAAPQVPEAARPGDAPSARPPSGGSLEASITPVGAAPCVVESPSWRPMWELPNVKGRTELLTRKEWTGRDDKVRASHEVLLLWPDGVFTDVGENVVQPEEMPTHWMEIPSAVPAEKEPK